MSMRVLFLVLSMILCFVLGNMAVASSEREMEEVEHQSKRKLSLEFDLFTSERVTTTNGRVPRVSCPVGTYRLPGGNDLVPISGVRQDGCVSCPKGTFGAVEGLTSRDCSGSCPPGSYSSRTGLTSADQCNLCPVGRYGGKSGLVSPGQCTKCPSQKFTRTKGSTVISQCLTCPVGYRGWQCTWDINPRFGADHDKIAGGA